VTIDGGNGMKSILAEFKAIFRNRKLLIPIVAVLFIPIMYSGMFLWAFWDPYGQLSDLPVAVVNNDNGAEFNGESLEVGSDLIENLKDSDQFDFHFVERGEAYKNLERQEYYLLVEIPENFSENAATLLEDQPKKLELKYVPNEGFNFLSSQIGENAIKEIKASLSKSVTETYAETMFDKIQEMGDGFKTASDNAGELNNGAMDLSKGAKELKENLLVLAEKNVEFNNGLADARNGAADLASGSSKVSAGLTQLIEKYQLLDEGAIKSKNGISELAAGIDESAAGIQEIEKGADNAVSKTATIHSGVETINAKLAELNTGAQSAHTGAQELNAGLSALQSQLQPLLESLPEEQKTALQGALIKLNKGSQELATGTESLSAGASQLEEKTGQLADGIGALNQGQIKIHNGVIALQKGMQKLDEGSDQLITGQNELVKNFGLLNEKLAEAGQGSVEVATGASKLNTGLNELYGGSTKLANGSEKAADGSSELVDGTNKLSDGTTEFNNQLQDASQEANSVDANDDTYDMLASPVGVDKKEINNVPNYGTGFTPYFLSLSLFVGALVVTMVYSLKEPADKPSSGIQWFLGKYAVLASVGIIQAVLACSILLIGLDLQVENIPLFYLFAIVTSLTYFAIIQTLVTILADPGRFIAIIILILQLTTSGGTFPLELIPSALQPIHALLPMSYAVAGFKAVISTGDFAFMWQNLRVLASFLVVFLIITVLFLTVLFKKKYGKLAEEM
jgi:putative membrane protein